MKREEVKYLYYITPIENLESILKYGILSNTESKKLKHKTVAMPEIQGRRHSKSVPSGKSLHDYVNLYFNPRNPMMYKRKDIANQLCVLIIHPSVLDINGVIVTDMNASRDIARFEKPESGLALLDKSKVYAHSWDHSDAIEKDRHKGIMCAETLVPKQLPAKYIVGILVSCNDNVELAKTKTEIKVILKEAVFFV